MRVGYLQFGPIFGKKQANRERVAGFLSDVKADLIVLPEFFASGYVFESREELMELAEEDGGETFAFMNELSLSMGSAIVGSVAERDGDSCYNTCVLCAGGEVKARYRKVHLFDREKELFAPGDLPFDVYDLGGVRIGMMICFDWVFPEAMRALALKGAQIVCHPSNLVLPYCPRAMITRCIENGVYAITTNRVGTEARAGLELTFIGMSQVIGPRGDVLMRANEEEEDLRVIDIDPRLANDKMITQRNHLIDDRRPDFYKDICARPEGEATAGKPANPSAPSRSESPGSTTSGPPSPASGPSGSPPSGPSGASPSGFNPEVL
jgi:predicted amidohydrolase